MILYETRDADEYSFAVPWANIGMIVLNFLVFFYELALDLQGSAVDRFLNAFSLVPCEYTQQCAVYPGTPTPFWITLFTSMFLHAGWAHILGNMLFLFVFGNHVESAMGHARYLVFYLFCGLGREPARDRHGGRLEHATESPR
jgi:membrane associated rhomboid family serine protease